MLELPFVEHLRELRRRIITSLAAVLICSVIAFVFYGVILDFLLDPLRQLTDKIDGHYLYVNTLFEGFLVKLKISLIAGAIFSLPVHVYHGIRFVFPGLNRREKKIILISLSASFVMIVFGFFYAYYTVIPVSVRFLTGSGFIPETVGLLLNFDRNIFYIFQFLLVFLLLFQLPIVLVVLMLTHAVQRATLLKSSRYVVIAIFILSAIVTPPDVVSQLSLAVPLVGMFFFAILIAKVFRLGEE